jgi:hypothetical protein
MAQPAANTAVDGPQAPSPEFTDEEVSTGFEHAGHFRDCALGLLNKAKHRHCENAVEALVIERQSLRLSLNKP